MKLTRRVSPRPPPPQPIKRLDSPELSPRPFWRPTPLEWLVAAALAFAWALVMAVVIKHEQAGAFLSVVYVLLGATGWIVSWLLVWPVLRYLSGKW